MKRLLTSVLHRIQSVTEYEAAAKTFADAWAKKLGGKAVESKALGGWVLDKLDVISADSAESLGQCIDLVGGSILKSFPMQFTVQGSSNTGAFVMTITNRATKKKLFVELAQSEVEGKVKDTNLTATLPVWVAVVLNESPI